MENYQFQLKEGEKVKQHASFSKKVFLLRNFLMIGWIGVLMAVIAFIGTIGSITLIFRSLSATDDLYNINDLPRCIIQVIIYSILTFLGIVIIMYFVKLSKKQSKQSFLTITNKRVIGNSKAFGIKTAIDMSLDKINTCSLVKVGFWEALGINSGGLMYKFIGIENAFNIMSSINQSIEDYNQHKTTEQAQKIADEISKNN